MNNNKLYFSKESVQLGMDLSLNWEDETEFQHDLSAGWDYYTDNIAETKEIGLGSTFSVRVSLC